jgi:hypothetical protein
LNQGETRNRRREWVKRAGGELLIIFVGVTAAFIVEGYRQELFQREEIHQATEGILTELRRYQVRGVEHADSISARLERWRAADSAGQHAVPGYYRIPGGSHPPTAAWDAAISSGVASLFDPELRLALGYFYTDFLGIHDNYVRRLVFIEREVLPRVEQGTEAFYQGEPHLRPEFLVEMSLLDEFGEDLRAASRQAAFLEEWLRIGQRPPETP